MTDINHEEIFNDKLKRKYKFIVKRDYINSKIEEGFLKHQKTLAVAGFRKGKVPITMVKKFKEREVINDVVNEQIKLTSEQFLQKNDFDLINVPSITEVSFNKDLKYNVEFELMPEIPDINIKELDIKKETVNIGDDEVDNHIKDIVKNTFDFIEAKKGYKAKEGDKVYIDFTGKIDNKIFNGGTGENFMVNIGSKSTLPEIEQALMGTQAQDKITVELTFPDDYPIKELISKQAIFSIDVKKIMLKKLVDDQDKLIKHFNCKTYNEFEEKARTNLQNKYNLMIHILAKKEIFDCISNKFLFDVPESTIKSEAQKISEQFKDKTQEEISLEAEKRVRSGFILMNMAKKHSIEVTDQDISNAIYNKAQNNVKNMQYMLDLYKSNSQAFVALKGEILEEKVTKYIVDSLTNKESVSITQLEKKYNEIQN